MEQHLENKTNMRRGALFRELHETPWGSGRYLKSDGWKRQEQGRERSRRRVMKGLRQQFLDSAAHSNLLDRLCCSFLRFESIIAKHNFHTIDCPYLSVKFKEF